MIKEVYCGFLELLRRMVVLLWLLLVGNDRSENELLF
jgi:hypothetical protein